MYTTKAISIIAVVLYAACLISPAEAQVSRLDRRFNINKSKPAQKTVSRTTKKRTAPTKAVTKPTQKQVVQTKTGVSPTARKILPSLMTILDPKYKGAPVYSLEQGNGNEIKYRYSIEMLPNNLELIWACDNIFAINEVKSTGLDDERTMDNHISLWNARTLRYISSWRETNMGVAADYRVSYDASKKQFYMAGHSTALPGGIVWCPMHYYALDLMNNIFESGEAHISWDDNLWAFKTRFKNRIFPNMFDFPIRKFRWATDVDGNFVDLTQKLGSIPLPEFRVVIDEHGMHHEVSSLATLKDYYLLKTIPQICDYAYQFAPLKKDALSKINFDTLSHKDEHASQIQDTRKEDVSDTASLDLSTVAALSQDAKMKAENLGSGYWLIYPDMYEGAYWALTGGGYDHEVSKDIYLYDSNTHECYSIPPSVEFTKSEHPNARVEYAFGVTNCGKKTINGCSIFRHGAAWLGPRLLSDSGVGEEDIVFEGNKVHEADMDGKKMLPIAYRVKTSPSKLPEAGLNVASLFSIWNHVPGSMSKTYWIAGEAGYCQLFLIDDDSKTGKLIHQWTGAWTRDSAKPMWMPEKRWMCLPVMENQWDIYVVSEDFASVQKLCSVYMGAGDAYAIILPNGKYAGTPGCESFLYKEDGDVRMGMSALALWRNRPAEVLEAIGGNEDDIEALKETTKRWLTKQGFDPENMLAEPKLSEFPVAEVTMPELFSEKDTVQFGVKLKATAHGIKKVVVRVDGVLIPQSWDAELEVAAGGEKEVTVDVPLASGQNWIEITPVDSEGISGDTFKFRTICKEKKSSDLYVVTLGVSDYDDDDLKLQYAAKDARDLAQAFNEYGEGAKHVLTLTDKEVRDSSVLDKVKAFLADAKVDDRVILYVAGHGMLDDKLNYYYAPAGFDSERMVETGIPMEALTACLHNTKAHRRLLLLDTCHSGMLGEEGEDKLAASGVQLPHGVRAIQHRGMKVKKVASPLNTNQKKRYIENVFSRGSAERGISIIAGAAGAEYAQESSEWNNGVFTCSIIQALRDPQSDLNGDTQISVSEIQQIVTQKVSELTGGAQRPSSVASEGSENFIITHGK